MYDEYVAGKEVRYSSRFDSKEDDSTRLLYSSDGQLLREAFNDRSLSKYSCIIVNEVYERKASTDALMALLKDITLRRQDLKVIIMSANIDADKFQTYFRNAPHLEVPGRQFPVKILYDTAA